jgi:hypothetical protein
MDQAWIGVIGTLAGGALVGSFGIIAKLIEQNTQGKSLSREKLEELHSLLFGLGIDLMKTHEGVLAAPAHRIEPPAMAEHLRGWMIPPTVKIFTIQELYASELESEFLKLLDAAGDYRDAAVEYAETGYVNSTKVRDTLETIKSRINSASDAVKDYMFAKNLIPNQRFVSRFKAAWRHTNRVLDSKR